MKPIADGTTGVTPLFLYEMSCHLSMPGVDCIFRQKESNMLSAFSFAQTPIIHFGLGKIKALPELIQPFGTHVILLTGASSFTDTRQWTLLRERLNNANLNFYHYVVDREPSPEVIDRAVRQYAGQPIGCVVAIGGGSVLDAGKAIAAMWGKSDSVKDYLEGIGHKEPDGRTLPFIAAPTTSGTGSEVTKNAVLSEVGVQGFKRSLRHDHYVPKIALIDPELAMGASPELTACSGMDAFTQLLEAYLSTNASSFTDMIAWEGLRYIKRSLLRAYREGRDLDARLDMAYASLLSGLALANAGLGTVHGFASSLGGRFSIPHGVICGTLMGSVNKYTFSRLFKDDVAFEKYANVGALFSGQIGKSHESYARYLIELIEEWTSLMKIPKLSDYGVQAADLPLIAEQTSNKNNPIELSIEDRLAILQERL